MIVRCHREPRIKRATDEIERPADGFRAHLHQVDVFGVAGGWTEMELVECCATPESQAFGQRGYTEQRYEGSADDEILLDPCVLTPRGNRPPLGDIRARDHRSGTTSMFSATFQRRSRWDPFIFFHGANATGNAVRAVSTGSR